MKQTFSVIAALLAIGSNAQGMGNGISKYTRGQADPKACLAFFENILGGSVAGDSCPGECECATQGRATIGGSGSGHHHRQMQMGHPHHGYHGFQSPPPQPGGGGFGLHSINCTEHPYGEMSLADVEAKVTAEVGDFTTMSQHMDSNVGIQVADLSAYITKLDESETKYPHMKQQMVIGGRTYNSLFIQACPGYFVDLISENMSQHTADDFTMLEETRYIDLPEFEGQETVVKVSRATTKIDEMIKFYTETIEGDLVSRNTTDERDMAIVKLKNAESVQLHFVNTKAAEGAKFTVADLETYVNSVHDKYVKSTNCGFDQFADHHWAYDSMSNSETLSSVAKKLEEGGHKYRWFEIPGNIHQIYAFDPSGWTFQLDFAPGNDVPSKCATYAASCKSDDGCYGQGLCDNTSEGSFFYESKNWNFFLN